MIELFNEFAGINPERQRESYVMFIEEFAWYEVLLPGLCYQDGTRALAKKMHPSLNRLAASMLVSVYSKYLPPEVVRRHIYNMRTFMEAGLAFGTIRSSQIKAIEKMGIGEYDTEAIKCIDRNEEKEQPLIGLSLEPLESTIHLYAFGIMVALVCLVVEGFLNTAKDKIVVISRRCATTIRYSIRAVVNRILTIVMYSFNRTLDRLKLFVRISQRN